MWERDLPRVSLPAGPVSRWRTERRASTPSCLRAHTFSSECVGGSGTGRAPAGRAGAVDSGGLEAARRSLRAGVQDRLSPSRLLPIPSAAARTPHGARTFLFLKCPQCFGFFFNIPNIRKRVLGGNMQGYYNDNQCIRQLESPGVNNWSYLLPRSKYMCFVEPYEKYLQKFSS